MPTRPEGIGDPAQHPYIEDSSCPNCQASPGRLAIRTDYVLYLRCERCFNTWTQPERRARKRLDRASEA
jgi:hypothetical protein